MCECASNIECVCYFLFFIMLFGFLVTVWVLFFGRYPSPLMIRDLGPPGMDGWIGFGSLRPIGVVI